MKLSEALLLKFLHKFFNRADIPWVHLVWEKHYSNGKLPGQTRKGSFWWRDILKLVNTFKGLTAVTPFIGNTCSLWNDLWCGKVPAQAFPELFSFAKLKDISLSGAAAAQSLNTLFHLPLSESAFQQLILLARDLQDAVFSEEKDVWSYIWGSYQF